MVACGGGGGIKSKNDRKKPKYIGLEGHRSAVPDPNQNDVDPQD
jgi:hypothetical protein